MRPITLLAVLVSLLLPRAGAAMGSDGEPGNCVPPCRSGFYCMGNKCVSQCNPPCPAGQRCVKGDCEPLPTPGKPKRQNFLALIGIFHGSLLDADNLGEIRIEFAGKYSALQIGPAFGNKIMKLRSAIQGRIPFKPFANWPLYLVPTIGLGYAFGWVDDSVQTHTQDIFIAPGFRLRYDVLEKMAILIDLVQLQISFLRFHSNKDVDVSRQRVDCSTGRDPQCSRPAVPITWNLGVGVAFIY